MIRLATCGLRFPKFEMPPDEGERYKTTVPDTLGLRERARLAIQAMTEKPNPQADYEPFWGVQWAQGPQVRLGLDSASCMPKSMSRSDSRVTQCTRDAEQWIFRLPTTK